MTPNDTKQFSVKVFFWQAPLNAYSAIGLAPDDETTPCVLVMQGGDLPFVRRKDNVDRYATGLMTGGNFVDGSGRGFSAQKTVGDGACLFNGTASAAFGMKCRSKRNVLAHSLPIRTACLKTALVEMEAMLSMDGWGWYYRKLHAYDAAAFDWSLEMNLDIPADVLLPVETARALYLFSVQASAGEYKDAQQFCFPLIAETLHVNLRVFNPGGSVAGLCVLGDVGNVTQSLEK